MQTCNQKQEMPMKSENINYEDLSDYEDESSVHAFLNFSEESVA